MALDSQLTQQINLRANGDALLRPLTAMGNQLNRLVQQMQQVANPSTAKGRKELEQLTKQAQTALGTLRTLNDLINAGSRTGRGKTNLLSGLSDQSLGKQVLSASKLRTELDKTTKSSDALEVRLTQLYKKFEQLGNAGKAVGQRDIAKALNTQEALKQVQALEREITRLDGRNAARGGMTPEATALRAQLQLAQNTLLSRVQNGRRADFTKEIAEVSLLADSYKKVTRDIENTATAAQRAASQRRSAVMDTINMNEAQLRASINRGAGQYSFTPEQARGSNIPVLNAQIEQGVQRLQAYQLAMSRAVNAGKPQVVIDRLAQSFSNLKTRISEAAAQKKAFDSLPEQRMKSLTSSLFADGGMAFGARILGASLITTGIFATINAAQAAARNVAELQDAFAKLQAISGSTDTEMQKFSASLMQLGENSRYSTLEIAEGATQLAQAGYSASETTKVLEASLNLAAGSGSTVSEAVDSMTSSLGAFNLQASEAGHVADVLMNGLNESKLSIQQMQAALQYAGATAHEAGISIEELTAISASMANAGIKSGSTIGTGIRQLLVDLQTPTDKFKKELESLGLTMADVDVKSKGLAEVVRTLTKAGFSAEAAYNGFEVRAAAAFLAFRNQIDVYDELSAKLTQTGAAAEAAGKANKSLSAQWQATKNTLGELVQILAGPFLNALSAVLSIVNTVVGGFVSFMKGLADAVGGAQNLSIVLTALLPVIGALFGPVGVIIGGVAALLSLGGAASTAADKMDKLQAATNEASEKMNATRQTVSSVDDAINRLIQRQDELRGNHVALQVETLNLTEKFEGLSSTLGGAAKSYDDLLDAMLRYRGQALKELGEAARGQALSARDQMGPLAGSMYQGNLGLLDRFNGSGAKRNGFKGDPELQSAYNWVNKAKSTPFENLNNDQLVDERLSLEKVINDLRAAKKTDGPYKWYLDHLNQQLNTLQQIASTRAKYDMAVQQFNVAQVATSSGEEKSFKTFTGVQSGVTQGLEANKAKPGSGDAILRQQMAVAKAEVSRMQARLQTLDQNSAEAKILTDDIARMQGEIAKVQRASDEATRDLLKNEKAGAGEDLTGSAVRDLITSQFKGANVYSYQKRSYKEQASLYNKYIHGQGPLAAKPGTSDHGSGHAVDITPIAGIDLDQVVKFLESRGVEIKQALDEKDPKTGRNHWHIAWSPKTSSYKKQADAELQHLLEQTAGDQTSALSTKIGAIISEAKGGAGDYSSDAMGDALAHYQQAAMHEWDVKHPLADAQGDPARLAARAKEKSAEWERVQEQIRKYWADYYKNISDKAIKESENAFKESQRILDEAVRKAEQISKDAQQQLDIAQNRTNRDNVGDGTMYVLNRRKENADLQSDQAKVLAQRQQIFRDQLIASQLQASVGSMPAGEAKDSALEKVAEAWAHIKEELQAVNDLQDSVNARTAHFAELPIKDRLEGAAQAWMEQNGAMDSFAKRAENFVGPALDNLKGGLTDMFSSLMDGTKTWKQALGDMLASFAKFVISYVAECLAMLAITELMKALGVPVPAAMKFHGGVTGSNDASAGTPAFNGALVVPGRIGGGSISDYLRDSGGRVNMGVSNRDSSLYNLAHGEYVVRNKSVRDLGLPFMDMINKHGAKGLAKMGAAGGVMQNFSMPKQETNVYVVKPDSAPPLGKNDILVTVHEDILQGGATKKLIKQVSQGA